MLKDMAVRSISAYTDELVIHSYQRPKSCMKMHDQK